MYAQWSRLFLVPDSWVTVGGSGTTDNFTSECLPRETTTLQSPQFGELEVTSMGCGNLNSAEKYVLKSTISAVLIAGAQHSHGVPRR